MEPGHPGTGGESGLLTARERDILSRIANGGTNLEIAQALSVSEDMVKTHTRRIYRKTRRPGPGARRRFGCA